MNLKMLNCEQVVTRKIAGEANISYTDRLRNAHDSRTMVTLCGRRVHRYDSEFAIDRRVGRALPIIERAGI